MINLNIDFSYESMPMHFELEVKPEQRIAIIGSSGAGKSTLLNLIAGFELADKGEIWLNNENHSYTQPAQRPLSILFQENNLFSHLTVEQNIALGIRPNLKLTKQDRQQIAEVAQAVRLQDYLAVRPDGLSGGQKQRVALARCLVRDKPILLLDEPFSALDPELRLEMLNLLDQISREKKLTVLIVTHQPNELQGKIDRILRVEKGRIVPIE